MDEFEKEMAKEIVSQTAGEAYKDIVHPAAATTGEIISFVPRTIKVWLGKWEKWILNGEYAIKETERLLAGKLQNVPIEKIVEPEAYVAVPAIQQLSYSMDSENLRELYANLLASSMNTETKWKVHPSFVDIIKQLTPDEAKLLKYIFNASNNQLPIINIQMKVTGKVDGVGIPLRWFSHVYENILESPENYLSYIDNFIRLNLCHIPGTYIIKDEVYDEILESSEFASTDGARILNSGTVSGSDIKATCTVKKLSLNMTDFGKNFCAVCISDNCQE